MSASLKWRMLRQLSPRMVPRLSKSFSYPSSFQMNMSMGLGLGVPVFLSLTQVSLSKSFSSNDDMESKIFQFQAEDIDGNTISLNNFNDKTMDLYSQGFTVLAFPCNQFGGQEPLSNPEIKEHVQSTYHVTFPLFAKILVNGSNAHPLYKFLQSKCKGWLGIKAIKWNFEKFLVVDGVPIKRYASTTSPMSIEGDIIQSLN